MSFCWRFGNSLSIIYSLFVSMSTTFYKYFQKIVHKEKH
nr:MAG TPA_asm: hypothetical protein [Caudoviricetes sp.]